MLQAVRRPAGTHAAPHLLPVLLAVLVKLLEVWHPHPRSLHLSPLHPLHRARALSGHRCEARGSGGRGGRACWRIRRHQAATPDVPDGSVDGGRALLHLRRQRLKLVHRLAAGRREGRGERSGDHVCVRWAGDKRYVRTGWLCAHADPTQPSGLVGHTSE